MKKHNYYLSNKDLYDEVVRCKKLGLMEPSPKLMKMFIILGQKIQSKMFYENQDDKMDCFQQGILDLINNWSKFNIVYKNPFAYYTQIFKNGMGKGWNLIHPKRNLQNISLNVSTDEDSSSGIHTL